MVTDSSPNLLGKKLFFLHPSAVVQNEVATELVQQEYEVYIVRDHTALRRVLKRYPDSIVFADIDERMSERDWEAWIRGTMDEIPGVGIGILSVNNNEDLQRKYINMVRVSCGFTVLCSDLTASIRQMLAILKAVDAKGRRKYIRASSENEALTTINLPLNGTFVNGVIKDISAAGLSCAFAEDPDLARNALFKDIQVKLQSTLLKVEGIVFGSRMDGLTKIYVILFTNRIDPEAQIKIRKYIQTTMQSKMDAEMK
ncbi:MAG: PilZ domain-containing protein [Treponema sp.]|jgi:hypothetical protein|nr:PilZ domain-containing protein [Treponema sp.]